MAGKFEYNMESQGSSMLKTTFKKTIYTKTIVKISKTQVTSSSTILSRFDYNMIIELLRCYMGFKRMFR